MNQGSKPDGLPKFKVKLREVRQLVSIMVFWERVSPSPCFTLGTTTLQASVFSLSLLIRKSANWSGLVSHLVLFGPSALPPRAAMTKYIDVPAKGPSERRLNFTPVSGTKQE
jgi:hypothetical protein